MTEIKDNYSASLAQLICEIRGSGHFLSYSEYPVLIEWIDTGVHPDLIAATLLEILTPYYSKYGFQKSLYGSRLQVLTRLRQLKAIQGAEISAPPLAASSGGPT